jgi:hypothetical protein
MVSNRYRDGQQREAGELFIKDDQDKEEYRTGTEIGSNAKQVDH